MWLLAPEENADAAAFYAARYDDTGTSTVKKNGLYSIGLKWSWTRVRPGKLLLDLRRGGGVSRDVTLKYFPSGIFRRPVCERHCHSPDSAVL